MNYVFKLGRNALKATKNIYCAKGESAADHSTVTREFKKFCLRCKNLDDQERSGTSQTVDSETVLPAVETNPASRTWRVSLTPRTEWFITGTTSGKASGTTELYLNLLKYCKIFDLPLYQSSRLGCRTYRLRLCREVRPFPWVSLIWHKVIWGSSFWVLERECKVPLHYHCSQVYSDPKW